MAPVEYGYVIMCGAYHLDFHLSYAGQQQKYRQQLQACTLDPESGSEHPGTHSGPVALYLRDSENMS